MRDFIFIGLICSVVAGLVIGWNALNPPPPRDYVVHYFGAGDCGACANWREHALPAWNKSDAGKANPVRIHEVRFMREAPRGGFGPSHDLWLRANNGRAGGSFPTFVLMDGDEIVTVKRGRWSAVASRVEDEFRRQQASAGAPTR